VQLFFLSQFACLQLDSDAGARVNTRQVHGPRQANQPRHMRNRRIEEVCSLLDL
jgi:hypothetical protein